MCAMQMSINEIIIEKEQQCLRCYKMLRVSLFDTKTNGDLYSKCKICRIIHNKKEKERYVKKKCSRQRLCDDEDCEYCFNRSFASYDGMINGKFKRDCWSSKNELTPRQLFKSSHKKCLFDCHICSHEFSIQLDQIVCGSWCSYCNSNNLCKNTNCNFCFNKSFASYDGMINGKLKVECWSNKNEFEPRDVTKHSNKKFIFDCDECGHDFSIGLNKIVGKKNWCSYCNSFKLCKDINCYFCFNKSFASYDGKTINGKLKVECWSNKNKLKPRYVTKQSNKKFIFDCDICGHDFSIGLNKIVGEKNWCSYCNSSKLCKDINCYFCFNKSFASYNEFIDITKSKLKISCWSNKNKLKPRDVTKKSGKKFIFDCNICGHKFKQNLCDITRGNWCPYCNAGKLCKNTNCNFCFNKSFASYQDKTTNGKLKVKCWSNKNQFEPRDITKNSRKKCWFDCDICGHTFDNYLSNIYSLQQWCSYCRNLRICNDKCDYCFNKSFASYDGKTINGKFKVECWSNKNKLTPRQVFKGSAKEYLFDCDECGNKFKSCPHYITSKKPNWCSICKNKTEKILFNWLKNIFPSTKHQFKAKWCRNPETNRILPFDFVIQELKIIIELDGTQHFEQVSNWKSPEGNCGRDKYKMKKANENGYTVIRIIQEDIWFDKNNWKENLKKELYLRETPTCVFISNGDEYKKHKVNDTDDPDVPD